MKIGTRPKFWHQFQFFPQVYVSISNEFGSNEFFPPHYSLDGRFYCSYTSLINIIDFIRWKLMFVHQSFLKVKKPVDSCAIKTMCSCSRSYFRLMNGKHFVSCKKTSRPVFSSSFILQWMLDMILCSQLICQMADVHSSHTKHYLFHSQDIPYKFYLSIS